MTDQPFTGEVPGKIDLVFECPKCHAEWLCGSVGGALNWKPPYCSLGHARTEMEQKFIGADGSYPTGATPNA